MIYVYCICLVYIIKCNIALQKAKIASDRVFGELLPKLDEFRFFAKKKNG